MASDADLKRDVARLSEEVARIEDRLTAVERRAGLAARPSSAPGRGPHGHPAEPPGAGPDDLEARIGELWVGQAGVVALLLGIAFFVVYPFGDSFPRALQSLTGYAAVIGFHLLARSWRSASPTTSRVLFVGNLILLYFCTLRLHFFNESPLIPSRAVGLALLGLALAVVYHAAVRRRSETTGVLAVLLTCISGLSSGTSHVALVLFGLAAAAAVALWYRHGWAQPVLVAVFAVYAAFLVWLFNDPLLGRPVRVLDEHHGSLYYLLAWAGILSLVHFRRDVDHQAASFAAACGNGLGLLATGMLVGLAYYRPEIWAVALTLSAFLLTVACALWVVRQCVLSTAVYACIGYAALTVAIVAHFGSPARFLWLGWQSLLVISMALWFRSRLIVVGNVVIFLGILLYYLAIEAPDVYVNLSYAAVALLSARIMNWQKQRLDLRTEKMRNLYLASAFVVVPYGLHHGVPSQFVSLAWLAAALFYFGMSVLLANTKYRWMAILTLLLAALRLVLVDTASLSPALRMVSFLALGLCLIGISFLYARRRTARATPDAREPE